MKLYAFAASSRLVAITALIDHLDLACERIAVDLSRGEQLGADYVMLNPNRKIPTLVDGDFVLWEAKAILLYLAAQRPQSGLWPVDTRGQADVVRWLLWQAAHLDAESWGMVVFEKASKGVLGLGPADPAFIARGEQNFARFAGVLDHSLEGRRWLLGEALTVADFAVGGVIPSANRMGLPIAQFPQVLRWYDGLAALPAWRAALADQDAAAKAMVASPPG